VSSLRHAIYIVGLSVFRGGELIFGEIHSFSHVQKGLTIGMRKDDYYLICRERSCKGFFVL
jgi:hypothetical protein